MTTFTKFRYGRSETNAWNQLEAQKREANEKFGTECIYIKKEQSDKSLANRVYLTAEFEPPKAYYTNSNENSSIVAATKTIVILGQDLTTNIEDGDTIWLEDTASNDGTYTILTITSDGTDSTIVVNEDLEDETLAAMNELIYYADNIIYFKIEGIDTLGDDNMFGKVGYVINNLLYFYCTISQLADLNIIPKKGDLIFSDPLNKKVFEITEATYESKNSKYPFGVPMCYTLTAKLYNPDLIASYDTGNEDVDSLSTKPAEMKNKTDEEIFNAVESGSIVDDSEDNPLD